MAGVQGELMPDWATDDTYSVDINEETTGQAKGALKNPSFPDTVGPDESWSGTIDACNIGDVDGTFRLAMNGETTDAFSVSAGSCGTMKIEGTGPAEFVVKLQLRV